MKKNDRLKEARKRAGFRHGSNAAEAMGVPPSTYLAHENGTRDFDVDTARFYARKFRVSEQWLLLGGDASELPSPRDTPITHAVPTTTIKISGIVEAGRFHTVDADEHVRFEPLEVPLSKKHASQKHMAFAVRGDSMNLAGIMDGDFVVGVEYQGVVRVGDIVVVERSRAAGQFIEWTVKEVSEVVPNDRIVLSPRSTNKAHKPVIIRLAGDEDGSEQVSILSLIVQVIRNLA